MPSLGESQGEEFQGTPTDSYARFLGGHFGRVQPRHFRRVLGTQFGQEVIDASVELRRGEASFAYRPTNEGIPALLEYATA